MIIATWNVNSIRQRIIHTLDFLKENNVDVLLLQETKCLNENFPKQEFEDIGYTCTVFGQKTFNGVAVISRGNIEDITFNLPNFDDNQSRYIEAVVNGNIRVASVYAPNGESLESEKFIYKKKFYKSLYEHMKQLRKLDEAILIGGDYNIAPNDTDTYDSEKWKNKILCSKDERNWFRSILNLGFSDSLNQHLQSDTNFTWWDYRRGSFEKNHGLRIDHILTNPNASDKIKKVWVDTSFRAKEKPSDHAPVLCLID